MIEIAAAVMTRSNNGWFAFHRHVRARRRFGRDRPPAPVWRDGNVTIVRNDTTGVDRYISAASTGQPARVVHRIRESWSVIEAGEEIVVSIARCGAYQTHPYFLEDGETYKFRDRVIRRECYTCQKPTQ